MRRRRNSPYGATAAEQKHLGWRNPRGRAPRTMGRMGGGGSGVLLGTLDELVVEVGGAARTVNKRALKGLFLAWMPGKRALAIVRKVKARPGRLDAATMRTHREFHSTEPTTAATYDWPEQRGARPVGLLRSLTYVVPPSVKSPEKQGYKWVHLFGDHGESGHGAFQGEKRYADSLKPMLLQNASGALFIQRRPGNKFNVTKWIYW